MRTSVRIFGGLAIGIVVCFIGASVAAITLGLTLTYFENHGIAAPYLTRDYTLGGIRTNGADIVLLAASVGSGLLALAIWLFATRESKRDRGAFSGAGLITAADNTPASRLPRKPPEQQSGE